MDSQPIKMDGAACIQIDDGSILIKRYAFSAWLAILLLSIFLLGFLWITAKEFLDNSFSGGANNLLTRIGWMLTFSILIFIATKSLKKKPVYINVPSRIIEIGQGSSSQQILFSTVLCASIGHSTSFGSVRGVEIVLILQDKKIIQIGSVSGGDAYSRATSIAQLVAKAIGVEMRPAI